VQDQQDAAVHARQDERGEGARQQRLPADPAQRGADAGGELGVFSELAAGLTCSPTRLTVTNCDQAKVYVYDISGVSRPLPGCLAVTSRGQGR
jgi:hypothetical protein